LSHLFYNSPFFDGVVCQRCGSIGAGRLVKTWIFDLLICLIVGLLDILIV